VQYANLLDAAIPLHWKARMGKVNQEARDLAAFYNYGEPPRRIAPCTAIVIGFATTAQVERGAAMFDGGVGGIELIHDPKEKVYWITAVQLSGTGVYYWTAPSGEKRAALFVTDALDAHRQECESTVGIFDKRRKAWRAMLRTGADEAVIMRLVQRLNATSDADMLATLYWLFTACQEDETLAKTVSTLAAAQVWDDDLDCAWFPLLQQHTPRAAWQILKAADSELRNPRA
jgi:hypothetical protein